MKKEEEYNAEVLQLMRDLYPTLKGEELERAERLFPELKESEDERVRKEIIAFITTTPKARNSHKKWIDWLEKRGEKETNGNEREIPNSKQKSDWSERDERMFDGLTSIVEDWYDAMSEEEKEYYGDCGYISWLKFLKERVQLQNWKPSEGQMNALYEANTVMYGGGNYHLTSLYNDLKKLKE